MRARILLDVTCLLPERISGIGIYCKNLHAALTAAGADVVPIIKASRIMKKNSVSSHIGCSPRLFFSELARLRFAAGTILHGPDFRLLSHSGHFRRVVTIHDLGVFHHGFNAEYFRQRGQERLNRLLGSGEVDGIVTPSAFVQAEIEARFPEVRGKVFTVYHGCDHLRVPTRPSTGPVVPTPYFLFAGTLEPRKNVPGLISAFEIVAHRHPKANLVLVGQDGAGAAEVEQRIEASAVRDRIHRLGYIGSEMLAALYAQASAFVFPSLYEGFGFPILEAMKLGCPVITSNRGSLPEIAGDAAWLAAPENAQDLAQAMHEVMSDEALRESLIERGYRRAAEFTWHACAERMLRVYGASE